MATLFSENSPVGTDAILNEVYKHAGIYNGIKKLPVLDDGRFNLSGITAYTRNTERVVWPAPVGLLELLNIKSPRIIFRVNNANPPAPLEFPWRFRRMTSGSVNALPSTQYVINHHLYLNWLENSASEDGIVALPCLTENGVFYIYFGLFRYTTLTPGENITNQNGQEIEIVGPGSSGDGYMAGARIPAP